MRTRSALALWNGVRMRTLRIGPDADAPMRSVTLPVGWSDGAAAALARLAPGTGAVSIGRAAALWIDGIDTDPHGDADLGRRLTGLLRERAAAPGEAVWRGKGREAASFVINLAHFAQPGIGFDLKSYVDTLGTATLALHRLGGGYARILLGNLDACLAGLGLDYDSDPARDVAACLTALASATIHPDAAPAHGLAAAPPRLCSVPLLAARAADAWRAAVARSRVEPGFPTMELFPASASAPPCRIESGFSTPGPVDALLGFEACGIAPVFSPLTSDGSLTASTLARLAARGISPEAAFAASLDGRAVLRDADLGSVRAMHCAVRPFIDRIPAAPVPYVPPHAGRAGTTSAGRRELPDRHGGFTQKAAVGGHRFYLRTGEYEDGSIGEIAISAVRDGSAQRGLMDAFGQAVSIGLQHGVPLDAYVEAFAYASFSPNGPVEGDTRIGSAGSVLDYAFRALALAYLGKVLPDAPQEGDVSTTTDELLLPLDLPTARDAGVRQRHGLRLVG